MGVLDDENSLAAGLFAQGLSGPGTSSGAGDDSPGARLVGPAPPKPSAVSTALVKSDTKPARERAQPGPGNIFGEYGKLGSAPFQNALLAGKVRPEVASRFGGRRAPVAMRNNNMGAISTWNAGDWAQRQPGYVGRTPRPKAEGGYYAKYATPEQGVFAASNLLTSYGEAGRTTPLAIASKWSTDRKAWGGYAKTIARYAGVGPNDPLDLSDPGVRAKVLMGMSAHESGAGVPVYNDEVFLNGVNGAWDQGYGSWGAPPRGTPQEAPAEAAVAAGPPMPRMRPARPASDMAFADPQDGVRAAPAAKAIQSLVKQPDGTFRPARAPQAAPAAPAGGRVTVGQGDSLWRIAERVYGDGNRWKEIAQANDPRLLRNPRSLQPGAVLTIPGAEADVPMPRMRPARPAAAVPGPDMSAGANRYGANEPGRGRGLLDQLGTFGPASGPPIPADGRAPPDTRWMDPGMTMTDPSMNADAWQTPPPGLVFGTVPTEGQFNERFAGPADRPVPSMDQFAERFGGQPPPAPSMAEFDQRFAPPAATRPAPTDLSTANSPNAAMAPSASADPMTDRGTWVQREADRLAAGAWRQTFEANPEMKAAAYGQLSPERARALIERYGQPVYAGPNGVVVFQVP